MVRRGWRRALEQGLRSRRGFVLHGHHRSVHTLLSFSLNLQFISPSPMLNPFCLSFSTLTPNSNVAPATHQSRRARLDRLRRLRHLRPRRVRPEGRGADALGNERGAVEVREEGAGERDRDVYRCGFESSVRPLSFFLGDGNVLWVSIVDADADGCGAYVGLARTGLRSSR